MLALGRSMQGLNDREDFQMHRVLVLKDNVSTKDCLRRLLCHSVLSQIAPNTDLTRTLSLAAHRLDDIKVMSAVLNHVFSSTDLVLPLFDEESQIV